MEADAELIKAASCGNIDKVRKLISNHGPDLINTAGSRKVLYRGMESDNPDIVKYLVMQGAGGKNNDFFRGIIDTDVSKLSLSGIDIDEAYTLNPLAVAITSLNRKAVKKMAEDMIHGVEEWELLNRTVMMWAAISDDMEIYEILADLGASVNRQDVSGYFALDEAIECGQRRARGIAHRSGFLSSRFWGAANDYGPQEAGKYLPIFRERALNNTHMIKAIAAKGGRSKIIEDVETNLLNPGFSGWAKSEMGKKAAEFLRQRIEILM